MLNMSEPRVRVRFAPSPTGPLHIGGVRTALFNYLYAKKHNGDFLLRIEDTDQTRFVPGAEGYINESLEWLGLVPDEGVKQGGNYGPYKQSERSEIYKKYVNELLDSGWAYYAFDTPEELEKLRNAYEAEKKTFSYDVHTRKTLSNSINFSPDETKKMLQEGIPYVVRFRMPENLEVEANDIIRGNVKFNTSTLDDKVIFKSDGLPTYHLANIVDDHLMKISHVIRGEEWLPSLPLHFMLYRAFGWEPPLFAHLPLLLKPDGKGKLSKRDGDKLGFPVFPLYWPYGETARGYREDGYYPEAFVNMLALLGWNPGTEQELFTLDELVEAFSIDRVHKAGSRFDHDKAKWFNHQYLRKKPNDQLAMEFRELLRAKGIHVDIVRLEMLVELVKERVSFMKDIWDQTDFFFKAPDTYDPEAVRKRWGRDTAIQMTDLKDLLLSIQDFSAAATETAVREWISAKGYNTGAIMNAFRLVIVGSLRGPHIFDIISWIGREESTGRIERGVKAIGEMMQ